MQTICDADLKIQDIIVRWPGSAYDLTIFNNSEIRGTFERAEMKDCLLVADSGYAQRYYLMTLVGTPHTIINHAAANSGWQNKRFANRMWFFDFCN